MEIGNIDLPADIERADWQRQLSDVPDEAWDVIVVGSGPAGAAAAIELASRRHRVLLLDRARFPREKSCGDGLVPYAHSCLRRAGVLEEVRGLGHAVTAARVFSPSRIEFEVSGDLVTLERRVLDALLCRRAVCKGAVAAQADVSSIRQGSDGTVICIPAGDRRQLLARVVVVATGADIRLLKDTVARPHPHASAVAMRCYVRSTHHVDTMVVSYDRTILPGYAWVFPMGDDLYNIGCGLFWRGRRKRRTNLRTTFNEFVNSFPLARELMDRAETVSPMRGGMLRCSLHGAPALVGDQVVCVGEAIGTTFAYTGEGIGKAMESGQTAASCISKALEAGTMSALAEYPRYLAGLHSLYKGHERAENWLSIPSLNDFISARVQRSRRLRDSLARVVAGAADPREVFSPSGIMRSLRGPR